MQRRAGVLWGAVALVFLAHAYALECVAEDAFITFRFARHWAAGLGLVWNPGEAPVEGYTNFLWLVLVAGMLRLGFDPLLGSQLLGVAASLGVLGVLWRAARRQLGWTPLEALIPCLALALSGPFVTWSAAGMETALFSFCVSVAVVAFGAFWREPGRGSAYLCSVALLLASLTRPEGLLVAALLLALALFATTDRAGVPARRLAGPGAAFALPYLIYTIWRWVGFGELLPNTFYAKTGGGAEQLVRGAGYVLAFLRDYGLPWLPLLALALANSRGRDAASDSLSLVARLRGNALLATCAVVTAAWLAMLVALGGDYMAMYRFCVPVLPLAYLLLGAVARRALRAPALAMAGLFLALGGTLLHSTPLEVLVTPEPHQRHGNWRGVETERWHVARLTALGRFFAGYAAPDESLVTDAIGAISWYSGMRVYGVHGLVDPELARDPERRRRIGSGHAGHERAGLAYQFARRPTFFMAGRELTTGRPRAGVLPADLDPAAAAEYHLVSVWIEDPLNAEAGWFSFLQRRDR